MPRKLSAFSIKSSQEIKLKTNIDQDMADRMVAMSLYAGVNFFDTANMYTSGESEIMLGKALPSLKREK